MNHCSCHFGSVSCNSIFAGEIIMAISYTQRIVRYRPTVIRSKSRKVVRILPKWPHDLHDKVWSGRLTIKTTTNQQMGRELRLERRVTVCSLSDRYIFVGRSIICNIVTEKLNIRKVYASWVLKMLTVQL